MGQDQRRQGRSASMQRGRMEAGLPKRYGYIDKGGDTTMGKGRNDMEGTRRQEGRGRLRDAVLGSASGREREWGLGGRDGYFFFQFIFFLFSWFL